MIWVKISFNLLVLMEQLVSLVRPKSLQMQHHLSILLDYEFQLLKMILFLNERIEMNQIKSKKCSIFNYILLTIVG